MRSPQVSQPVICFAKIIKRRGVSSRNARLLRHDRQSTAEREAIVHAQQHASAEGDVGTDQGSLPPGQVKLMESTYRGVVLLATLKRDEMFRDGRHEEHGRMLEDARKSQSELFSGE